MADYTDVKRKDTTHGKYLRLLSTFQNEAGISLKSNKREILDYLEVLIRDNMSSIRMKEVKILREIPDIEGVAFKLGSFLNFSINNSVGLTKTAGLLGKTVLMGFEPPLQSQRDRNITRVKVGIELLDLVRCDKKITFRREAKRDISKKLDKNVKKEVIDPKTKKKKKTAAPYKIKVVDEKFAFKLGLAFHFPDRDHPIYTQPLLEKPYAWKKFFHPVMGEMVRNVVENAEQEFTLEKAPKVYAFMNKIRHTSFNVNTPLLSIFIACQDDPLFTHKEKDFKPVQLASIMQQQVEVLRIADSLGDDQFYLSSFLDFRGRFYYANTYFHPQGNKVARSLFKFSGDGIPIGKSGYKALLASAASEFGQDKLSFKKKVLFAKGKLQEWMMCAADPMNHKSVWQISSTQGNACGFLSIIMEIYKALTHQAGKKHYKSTLPIFIDASNSGTQILSALGRDPVGGRLSNLIPSEERGDVYLFVAKRVWATFKYTKEDEAIFEVINAKIMAHQAAMDDAFENEKWDELDVIRADYKEFYAENKETIRNGAKVFWSRLEHMKRKLCKRPVMTIPYSAGARTISRSMYKDWRPEPELKGLTSAYCFVLADAIVEAYSDSLEIPTDMMNLFIKLGLRAYKKKKDFSFKVPGTGFHFAQNARKDKMERFDILRKNQRLQLNICVGKDEKIDYDGVKSASSPNAIHALDAALMMMIVKHAQYPMMVIHDSFATYPGAYKQLHKNVRERFVEMFEPDVLMEILLKCNSEDLKVAYGDLDIEGILDNEYSFSV